MHTIFYDVHDLIHSDLVEQRVEHATFDDILFAHDTICISKDPGTLTMFLQVIEHHSAKYGLALNRGKCEVLTISKQWVALQKIKFLDGSHS